MHQPIIEKWKNKAEKLTNNSKGMKFVKNIIIQNHVKSLQYIKWKNSSTTRHVENSNHSKDPQLIEDSWNHIATQKTTFFTGVNKLII